MRWKGTRKWLFNCNCVGVILILCNVVSFSSGASKGEEVIFYEDTKHEGSRLFVKLGTRRCYTMEKDWDNRVSSVDTQGHCIIIWEYFGCKGVSVKLAKNSEAGRDLGLLDFDKALSSISVCPSERRAKSRHTHDEGLDIWRIGLEEHNKYRKMHAEEELIGDIDLHQEAQGHADYLVRKNKFEASSQMQHGENLATSYEKDKLDAIRDVVKRWYDKIELYNFDDPESNKKEPKSGQFSSIVWKATTHLGVGVAWNPKDKKWIVVCMYSPPATTSRYTENVNPPVQGLRAEAPHIIRTAVLGNVYNNPRRRRYFEAYDEDD